MKAKWIAIGLAALTSGVPALAQESSYVPTTVWEFSNVRVAPGQIENYMDYLGKNWMKVQEMQKKAGFVVSYHVFSVNDARENEPNLILAVEYKDYRTTAQHLDDAAKARALLGEDTRQQATAAGARSNMRKQLGSMELHELKFK